MLMNMSCKTGKLNLPIVAAFIHGNTSPVDIVWLLLLWVLLLPLIEAVDEHDAPVRLWK